MTTGFDGNKHGIVSGLRTLRLYALATSGALRCSVCFADVDRQLFNELLRLFHAFGGKHLRERAVSTLSMKFVDGDALARLPGYRSRAGGSREGAW